MVDSPYTQPASYRPDAATDAKVVAVDHHELHRAGRVFFPQIAATYATMTTDVHEATGYAERLFEGVDQGNTLDDYRGGTWRPPVEPAHRKLLALREQLQEVFWESASVLYDTGQALTIIADLYRDADGQNAELLNDALDNDPVDGVREAYDGPPVQRPDPPAVGGPHRYVPPSRPETAQVDDGHLTPDGADRYHQEST